MTADETKSRAATVGKGGEDADDVLPRVSLLRVSLYTAAELKPLKVAGLKKLLKEHGLSTKGRKAELRERLAVLVCK